MLEGILNAGDQAMGQQDQQPQQAPAPSTSFDVQNNPQDMQAMTDSMMYVPMLHSMTEEQRKEKWPDIVNSLSQVSPKAGAMLDPTLPPSTSDLSALMKSMSPQKTQVANTRDDYNQAQVQRQLQGLAPQSQIDWEAEQAAKAEKAKTDPHGMNALNDTNFLYEAGKFTGQMLSKTAGAIGEALLPSAQAGTLDSPVPTEDPRLKGAPAGKMWVDPNNADAGTKVIPGGAADKPYDNKEDPKVSNMLLACKQQLPNIQQLLFDGQGGVKQSNITGMSIHQPGRVPGVGEVAGVSNGDAAQLSKSYETCIQAVLRSEYPNRLPSPDVISSVRDLYKPSSTDSTDEVYQKMFTLKAKVNGYLSQVTEKDGNGDIKFNQQKAQAEMSAMQNELYSYKKDWMKQVLADPKNQAAGMTPDDAGRLYNQKMLVDGDFVRYISNKVKNDPNRPSKEMF